MRYKRLKCFSTAAIIFLIVIYFGCVSFADPVFPFKFGFNVEPAQTPQETAASIQILLLLTVLSLAPSILIMMTSFTRIIVVLSFMRNALGTQQMPPNQVLIGLALFLTLFVMSPVVTKINDTSLKPYSQGQITQQQALDKAGEIIKSFMIKQIFNNDKNGRDLELFVNLAKIDATNGINPMNLPLTVVIPAFMISELTVAFKMGFLIYLPFLVIDMIVSSTLMSMGMMMLPPIMISLPFKILLFVLAGGWNLLSQMIITSFAR